jgi:hypothetical protein
VALAPVGLLVIPAWVEEGSGRPLRVVVRLTADSGRGFERELMFSEPAAVEALGGRGSTTGPSSASRSPLRATASPGRL